MKVLISALQDSVTFLFLLGAQVIIVASLAMMGLWLYFKRLRNTVVTEAGLEESVESPASAQPLDNVNDIHLALIRDLENKVTSLELKNSELMNKNSEQELQEERQKTEELKKLNIETAKKINVLESKLLEYEVIKDEIGLVGQLKAENEKLKELSTDLEKQLAGLKTQNSVEIGTQVEAEPVVEGSSVSAVADPGIEGLLNEIEALTAEKKELQRKKA